MKNEETKTMTRKKSLLTGIISNNYEVLAFSLFLSILITHYLLLASLKVTDGVE